MIIVEMKDSDSGKVVGMLMALPKDFKTGSRGFYANSKIEVGGKRYQAQVQLVEIGSKPKAETDKAEDAATA